MDAIKKNTVFLLALSFFISFVSRSQNGNYPKDTIYLMYKDTTFLNYKMKAKEDYVFKGKKGVKFLWKSSWLFYDKDHKTDTLSTSRLKNYKTVNLKELREKEINWVDRKFKRLKYKPYSGNKNAVFQTYLIELISEDKFVIYPVIWCRGYDNY